MSRKERISYMILFGIYALGALAYYITRCGWQPLELLVVLISIVAAFCCGLCLATLGGRK